MASTTVAADVFISPQALLGHWQGHRRLTRRVIEAFPEEAFRTFSVGGMRPFGDLAMEMVRIAAPMVRGIATSQWDDAADRGAKPRQEVLRLWDEATAELYALWPRIPPGRFQETITAFGQWEGRACDHVLYAIDNEIHHRGQGYVYLRALGITPPAFYER
jgi:uncharacterized damage-inducible protein DinB